MVEDVLDIRQGLDPVVAEYAALLEQVTARWLAQGVISSTYAELPFAQRMAHVLNEAGPTSFHRMWRYPRWTARRC